MFLSSTYWDEETRARALALGAVRYLARPLDPQILLAGIRACLAHA
jgi:DNA-binding response OmpR family regulator